MDGSNFDPNQKLPIKTETVEMEMETESELIPSLSVPEAQRYTPKESPKYLSEQKNLSEDYNVSPMPESPRPLPDDCPDWFLPWKDFTRPCVISMAILKNQLIGSHLWMEKAMGYNATVLTLIKWDQFPDKL